MCQASSLINRNVAILDMNAAPTAMDVEIAARRIGSFVARTPLLISDVLNKISGGQVFLKAECMQHTGSFKLRGAINKMQNLSINDRRNGVIAWSSGNHAQAVAVAARQTGTSAKIVMPTDAPTIKIDGTRAHGAEIIFYDRATEDREAIAQQIAKEDGRVIIPSYDDPEIIAGQGTVGLELIDQAYELGVTLQDIIVPVSGGGLLAGIGLAVKSRQPNTKLYSVEPDGFDDHRQSLESGQREVNPKLAGSLCDALLAPTPGFLTWPINQIQLDGGYAITEKQALSAMAFAHTYLNLKLEPSGALPLAAIITRVHSCQGRSVALVLSGGNVDIEIFARAFSDDVVQHIE